MPKTLRRSCDACAKSKLSCDLRTPQCSRCIKRKSACVYANPPLTSSLTEPAVPVSIRLSHKSREIIAPLSENAIVLSNNPDAGFLDPFDSYPRTKLPRAHVQRLIHHFLSSIAFQYYPLDLSVDSNPFVVSWWPLALADPALFHVSLQTASLDLERRDQRGFPNSELLMIDSVSLVRQRIEDSSLACQDETMNSVVTLAAIEHGKGNDEVSKMHIHGVQSMVHLRGGIQQIMLTSPLTARMVSWVSLIVMQAPQFPTQNDFGIGDGIPIIPQWRQAGTNLQNPVLPHMGEFNLDPTIQDILYRLSNMARREQFLSMSNTELHDLTCFVLHRLLLWRPNATTNHSSGPPAISECVRDGLVLYMLIIHGPTYYSHSEIQNSIVAQLEFHLEDSLAYMSNTHQSLVIWLLSMGMVAAQDASKYHWFATEAKKMTENLGIRTWNDIVLCLQSVLWLKMENVQHMFQQKWGEISATIAI